MEDAIRQKNVRLRESHFRFLASKKKQGFSNESEYLRKILDDKMKREGFKG